MTHETPPPPSLPVPVRLVSASSVGNLKAFHNYPPSYTITPAYASERKVFVGVCAVFFTQHPIYKRFNIVPGIIRDAVATPGGTIFGRGPISWGISDPSPFWCVCF